MNLSAYSRLFRIEHAFMLSFATYLGLLAVGHIPNIGLLGAILAVPFFIEMGAFALNDYYDVEADRLNKRDDRPIASGEISEKEALFLAMGSFLVANVIAAFLGKEAFAIAFGMSILSWYYNKRLKDLPLIGNAFIALTMAMPFIFAYVIAGKSNEVLVLLMTSAFFIGLGREIVKDIEDVEGDVKARGSKTLPALFGKKVAKTLALISFAGFLANSFLLMLHFLKNTVSLVLFLISIGLFSYSIGFLLKGFKLDVVRKISLASMAVGMVAVLAGLIL